MRQALSSRSYAQKNLEAPVDRYLLPRENRLAAVRQHPAILIPTIATALGGVAVALAVNGFSDQDALSQIVTWIVAGFFMGRLVVTILRWAVTYVVITSERFMITNGIFARRVQSIAIDDLRQMTFERSFFGRLVGYGTFIIDSGISQLVMDGMPYSEQLYFVVTGQVFSDSSGRAFYDGQNADVEAFEGEDYDTFTLDDLDDAPVTDKSRVFSLIRAPKRIRPQAASASEVDGSTAEEVASEGEGTSAAQAENSEDDEL